MISSRPAISERRAATARANGAKSRGPVTAQGKANSSRNSFRHGLRSKLPRADPESENRWAAILASFMHDLKPQSELERRLVETMAFCHLRRTSLWKLETTLMNQAMHREIEDSAPPPLLAFHALRNASGPLELLTRFEERFERQFTRAFDRFQELCGSRLLPIKSNIDKRSHQITENKATEPGASRLNTQSNPTEPEPKRSTDSERQTVMDRPNLSAKCISPLQAAAATQTP